MIRLGKRPALGTIAHELGHHLVNHLEPPSAPAHGRAWVAWFDAAAAGIVDWCRYHGLDLDRRGERQQANGRNRRVRDPVPAAGA